MCTSRTSFRSGSWPARPAAGWPRSSPIATSASSRRRLRPNRRAYCRHRMADVGRMLLVFGVLLVVIGGALMLFGRFHLPGEFTFRSGSVTDYTPLATSVILPIAAHLVLNLVFRQRCPTRRD